MTIAQIKMLKGIRTYDFSQCITAAGVAGMFICGFGILLKKSVAHFGLLIMTLSFLLNYKKLRKEDIRDPLLALSIAFLLFISIRAFFAALEYPANKTLIVEGSFKLLGTGFFLTYLFGYWMHQARDKWDELLIIIMMGYLLQILRNTDWIGITDFTYQLWSGAQRATFGFATNRFGLFSVIILLACLVLYRQIWGTPGSNAWHWTRIAFWGIISCMSAMGVVFSQSRSAWLGGIAVIPLILLLRFFGPFCKKNLKWKTLLVVGTLLSVAFFTANFSKIIAKRVANGIDADSISARLSIYEIAWENWKKYPLVGRGPGTSRLMIQAAEEKYNEVKIFDHFHNVVLDIGAQSGIIGLAFLVFSAYIIIRQGFRAKHEELFKREFRLFALGGIAIMLLTGIPNQPFHSPHGVYMASYLGGICYSSKFVTAPSCQPLFTR